MLIPVSGRSAPSPAKRSTVLLRSSELGPFSDTSPHKYPKDFNCKRIINMKYLHFMEIMYIEKDLEVLVKI